jgi:membrane-bound metal-dependent hydrolase YbcI (DUF457 family)
MRIGHAAVALIAKRARPTVSLVALGLAAYGPDILDGLGALVRVKNRELSHSLVSLFVFATLSAGLYFVRHRNLGDAFAVWLVYVLHWPADFITGNKPTWPGGPTVGLNLYDRPTWDWTLETALFAVAVLIAWPVLPVPRRRQSIS